MKKTIKYHYEGLNGDGWAVGILFFYPIIQAIIAILLLIPALIGIVLTFIDIYDSNWNVLTSDISSTPIFFGLMAIAGTYMSNVAYNNFLRLLNINSLDYTEEENK